MRTVLLVISLVALAGWNLVQQLTISELRTDLENEEKARVELGYEVRGSISGLQEEVTSLTKATELREVQDAISQLRQDAISQLRLDLDNLEFQKGLLHEVNDFQEIQILQVLGKLAGGVVFDASDCIELNRIWVSGQRMSLWVELHSATPDLTLQIEGLYEHKGLLTDKVSLAELTPGSVVQLFCGGRVVFGIPEVYLDQEAGYGFAVHELGDYNSAIRLTANSN